MSRANSLGETADQWRGCFREASVWFVSLARHSSGRISEPGLGEWTVLDLVGHTSRSLLTVEAYLTGTDEPVTCGSAGDYFRAMAPAARSEEVTERGRQAGAALGDDPSSAVEQLRTRVARLVDEAADDARVGSPAGLMLLSEYLPTRTFELVVHGCDLSAALDLPILPPVAPAGSALRLVGALAADDDRAGILLLALTGRRPLPPGFSVL